MARSEESKFYERFGYARWIRHLVTGEAPAYALIAKSLPGEGGEPMTGQAVSAWKARDEPPTNWRVHEPLAAALGVEPAWLIRNQGEPPRPDLWQAWLTARRGVPEKRATGIPQFTGRPVGKTPAKGTGKRSQEK